MTRNIPNKNMTNRIIFNGYEYVFNSDNNYFKGKNSNLTECWHGNPCTDKSKTCVITRGLGTGIYNGMKYPKGYCE